MVLDYLVRQVTLYVTFTLGRLGVPMTREYVKYMLKPQHTPI